MSYRRMEIKDDGDVVVIKMGEKDFARFGKIFSRLDIPAKEASKKEAIFIFSRSDYYKVLCFYQNFILPKTTIKKIAVLEREFCSRNSSLKFTEETRKWFADG